MVRVTVIRSATAWQKSNHHFDPKSSAENPTWYTVDIRLEEIFGQPQTLDESAPVAGRLAKMELLRRKWLAAFGTAGQQARI